MAPSSVTTPAPVAAPKAASVPAKIDTSSSKAGIVNGLASAASSLASSIAHSHSAASTLSRTESTNSEVSIASSASASASTSVMSSSSSSFGFSSGGSSRFGDIEIGLHRVAINITIDVHNGDLIADGVLLSGGKRIDGVRFELAKYLGNVDGVLKWYHEHKDLELVRDYYKTCKDIKIIIEHDGCYLIAQCKKSDNTWVSSRFNLSEVLYILRGRIEVRNSELTRVLSEVPWMKFKVVAEPDFAVFFQHEMMQKMMNKVTLNVVNHVTAEMNLQIALAVEAATKVVAESAMTFAMEQMQVMVQSASLYGKAQRSSTVAEHLHMF